MDSVAAQPTPPAVSSSRHKLAHLLKPLRKSASSRDLQQYSTYDEYKQRAHPITQSQWESSSSSPSDAHLHATPRSNVFPYTPPTSFGFASNKGRMGRALAEGGAGGAEDQRARDMDYIPYHGPISPPPATIMPTFAKSQGEEVASDRRLFLHPDRHHQFLPHPDGSPLVAHEDRSNGEWHDGGAKAQRGEIPRYKDAEGDLLGLGLGVAHAESWKAPDMDRHRSFLSSGLPSAYTHGGNAPAANNSSRSVANQSYLPSLLRFDPQAVERSAPVARPREIIVPGQGASPSSYAPHLSQSFPRKSFSATNSPATAFPTLMRPSSSADRATRGKAGSVTSSDGHDSSLANEGSASTSMTSLRDQASMYGKYRASQDGTIALRSSTKTRPRASTATSFASDRGKERGERPGEVTIIARDYVDAHLDSSAASIVSQSKGETPPPPPESHARYRLSEAMVRRQLSPISSSNPGHQSEFSPTGNSTMDTNWSNVDQAEQDVRGKDGKRSSRMHEAHRNYLLLQQLHLDEMTSHSTDHAGYLEAKNGCERVLMPKPSLRGRTSRVRHESMEGPSQSPVAFERHRRLQTKSNPHLSESAKAQEILSSPYMPATARRAGDSSLLFHHRMPPPTPSGPSTSAVHFVQQPPIKIPPRRSSHSRRRADTAPSTPALTPNLMSDDDGDDDDDDLQTVLAQGRALEEERERWRNQHHRSIGKSKSQSHIRSKQQQQQQQQQQHNVDSSNRRVRYHEEPLPNLDTFHRYAGDRSLRQAKSSPNLRSETALGEKHGERAEGDAGVPTLCLALQAVTTSRGASAKTHSRSRSQDSSPGLADGCFAALGRRRRSKTVSGQEEKRSGRLSHDARSVWQSAPPSQQQRSHQHALQPQSKPEDAVVVIGRQNMPTDEAPASREATKTASPYHFPHRSNASASSSPSAYGIAFSAPRPDIGRSAPKDPTFFAGRHATQLGYHRPSNSDDLRAMLSTNGGNVAEPSSSYKVPRKAVGWGRSDEYDQAQRPAAVRIDSLGMSRAIQTIDDDKKQDVATSSSPEPRSLPVPPRRQRSSQVISASASPSMASAEADHTPTPHFTTPFVAMEGFSTPDALATPTLGRPGPGLSPAVHDQAKPSYDTASNANLPSNRNSEEEPATDGSTAQRRAVGGRRGNLVVQSSSSSDDSNYSPRSVAARELWNTDDHAEESFSSLFFRRPSAGNSGLRQAMTMQEEGGASRSETDATPRANKTRKVAGDSLLEAMPDMRKTASRDGSVYRTSLQQQRNSDDVEKMVGSYLHRSSGGHDDASFEAAFNEPAWNDSTIDLHLAPPQLREEVRLGRIDDRRPRIQQGYRATDEHDEEDSEEEGAKTTGGGGMRARLLSFAASLVMAGEGDGDTPPLGKGEEKQLSTGSEEKEPGPAH